MIGIICDTGTDVPSIISERDHVEVVQLKVVMDDLVLKDGVADNFPKIIKYMETGFPKTTLPSFVEVKEKIVKLIDKGMKEIIGFNLSHELSGTHNLFRLVAEEIRKEYTDVKIEIIDTLSVSIGCANYIFHVAELIEKGESYEEILEKVKTMIPEKSKVFFTIPTLKYLKAGGRIGKVSGTIADVFNLKPIISVGKDGIYYTAAKARGLKKAYKKVKELAYSVIKSNSVKVVGIAWTGQTQETLHEVEQIKQDLESMGITNYYSGHINSTLLVNTGLDLIGIGVLVE
ncbi:MAG: DegV family protein [Thermotogota bacterium]